MDENGDPAFALRGYGGQAENGSRSAFAPAVAGLRRDMVEILSIVYRSRLPAVASAARRRLTTPPRESLACLDVATSKARAKTDRWSLVQKQVSKGQSPAVLTHAVLQLTDRSASEIDSSRAAARDPTA